MSGGTWRNRSRRPGADAWRYPRLRFVGAGPLAMWVPERDALTHWTQFYRMEKT